MAGAADLAVDFGSSTIRVSARTRGIVLEIPSAIATRPGPRGPEVVAVGKPARRMLGRTPADIKVVRPVRGGVVVDFPMAEALLRHALKNSGYRSLRKPRVLVAVPSGTTEVERRAILEVVRAAGARDVTLVSTSMCAAIGAGIPVSDPSASLLVDVGGGRTDVGIVCLGGLVVRRSLPVAGAAFDTAIATWVRRNHNLLIGDATAEAVKWRVGVAAQLGDGRSMRIRGRDLPTGGPREIDITTDDTAEALAEPVTTIRQIVLDALREAPPEVAGDIHDRGLVLCGGGSTLLALDRVLSDATHLPVLTPDAPERAVALGAAMLLDDPALLEVVVHSQ